MFQQDQYCCLDKPGRYAECQVLIKKGVTAHCGNTFLLTEAVHLCGNFHFFFFASAASSTLGFLRLLTINFSGSFPGRFNGILPEVTKIFQI